MSFNFKKLFHKSAKHKQAFKLVTFDALKDWKRLFFFFLLMLVGALSWGGFVFWEVQTGYLFSEKEVILPEVPSPDSTQLTAIKEYYEQKAKLFETYSTSRPESVDPAK